MSPKLRTVLILMAVIVPADQLSKYWVAENVSPWAPLPIIEGFLQITHARNPGAALGILQELPIWVFIGLAGVALVLIGSFYRRLDPNDRLSAVSLGMKYSRRTWACT